MGSVCQRPNSKSDQSACSGKQDEWFNYKTKDVKIDETKHPRKCFPFETILLLTTELERKKKRLECWHAPLYMVYNAAYELSSLGCSI